MSRFNQVSKWLGVSHKDKMERKRVERRTLTRWHDNRLRYIDYVKSVAAFAGYWHGVNGRNGLSGPKSRARARAHFEAQERNAQHAKEN